MGETRIGIGGSGRARVAEGGDETCDAKSGVGYGEKNED